MSQLLRAGSYCTTVNLGNETSARFYPCLWSPHPWTESIDAKRINFERKVTPTRSRIRSIGGNYFSKTGRTLLSVPDGRQGSGDSPIGYDYCWKAALQSKHKHEAQQGVLGKITRQTRTAKLRSLKNLGCGLWITTCPFCLWSIHDAILNVTPVLAQLD